MQVGLINFTGKQMFHDGFPFILGSKGYLKVVIVSQKNGAGGVGICTLVSAGF